MTQAQKTLRHLLAVGEDDAGIAQCAQELHRPEADAGQFAEGPARPAVDGRAESLRAVLDDDETMPLGDLADLCHGSQAAGEMYGQDRLRPGRDQRLYCSRVEV